MGLERTFYAEFDNVSLVEVCTLVHSPNTSCPISYPFNVRLSTEDDTAGNVHKYLLCDILYIVLDCVIIHLLVLCTYSCSY